MTGDGDGDEDGLESIAINFDIYCCFVTESKLLNSVKSPIEIFEVTCSVTENLDFLVVVKYTKIDINIIATKI